MCLFKIASQNIPLEALKGLLEGNIWSNNFRKSQVLLSKLIAMVRPDNLGN